MSITRFNKDNLQEIREAIESALIIVREETGLNIELKRCRFDNNVATFKLEAKTVDNDGKAFDEAAANFKVFAKDFELNPDDLGKTFVSNFQTYTICGLKPRNRKYPIIACRTNGKKYKFSSIMVRRLLNNPDSVVGYQVPKHK